MKRILILSYYYPPDLSAGSFRVEAMVEALFETSDAPIEVEVLTTTPNRYSSFESGSGDGPRRPGLTVHRLNVPAHTGGFVSQVRGFGRFFRQALRWVRDARQRGQHYDQVVATSSRLMTAFLGAQVARVLKAPLFLDIRDIFTESIRDVYRGGVGAVLFRAFSLVERYTLRRARRVNVVSEAFRRYFESRYPGLELTVHTNGIDDVFLLEDWSAHYRLPERPFWVLYAGNVGVGQALSQLLPQLAKAMEGEAEFYVVGDGTDRVALDAGLASEGVANVKVIPPVSRAALLEHYHRADVLLLQLNDLPAFERVLPSKLFEYAATGKPILAGVRGYAREFLQAHVDGVSFFEPNDSAGAEAALRALEVQYYPRAVFRTQFSRREIMRSLAREICSGM
jgi:glycosyltransferase involved in cell wall biosynthesis